MHEVAKLEIRANLVLATAGSGMLSEGPLSGVVLLYQTLFCLVVHGTTSSRKLRFRPAAANAGSLPI